MRDGERGWSWVRISTCNSGPVQMFQGFWMRKGGSTNKIKGTTLAILSNFHSVVYQVF